MTTELPSQPDDDDAFAGYAPPEERPPFIPYAIFAATFNAGLVVAPRETRGDDLRHAERRRLPQPGLQGGGEQGGRR